LTDHREITVQKRTYRLTDEGWRLKFVQVGGNKMEFYGPAATSVGDREEDLLYHIKFLEDSMARPAEQENKDELCMCRVCVRNRRAYETGRDRSYQPCERRQ
jgi:hypothetical protein